MTRLEQAITNIVDVFLAYAGDEPKKPKLCQKELKNLMEQEIQSPEMKVRDTGHWHDTEISSACSLGICLTMTLSSLRSK